MEMLERKGGAGRNACWPGRRGRR